ncbi:MAG: hypothetical protein VB032_04950 [Burkholderiaceae bacterium]|nr:hypothetical protein [Burkholderiaceae bacterium]
MNKPSFRFVQTLRGHIWQQASKARQFTRGFELRHSDRSVEYICRYAASHAISIFAAPPTKNFVFPLWKAEISQRPLNAAKHGAHIHVHTMQFVTLRTI